MVEHILVANHDLYLFGIGVGINTGRKRKPVANPNIPVVRIKKGYGS